jgi:hypothetical protein
MVWIKKSTSSTYIVETSRISLFPSIEAWSSAQIYLAIDLRNDFSAQRQKLESIFLSAQKNEFGTGLTGGPRAEQTRPFNSFMRFKRKVISTTFLLIQVHPFWLLSFAFDSSCLHFHSGVIFFLCLFQMKLSETYLSMQHVSTFCILINGLPCKSVDNCFG